MDLNYTVKIMNNSGISEILNNNYQRNLDEQNKLTLPKIFSDTSNEQKDSINNFVGLLIACFLMTTISFYIWKICLFEKYGAYLPIDKNIDT